MGFDIATIEQQRALCTRYNVALLPTAEFDKIGIARNVKSGIQPINGLRHPPCRNSSGWYIWASEHLSNEEDFFLPLHAVHLEEWCPAVIKFLGLPAGWRFLIAEGYEDVWFDPALLQVNPQN